MDKLDLTHKSRIEQFIDLWIRHIAILKILSRINFTNKMGIQFKLV
jgi:hypothetical protein